MKENIILEKSYLFAKRIVGLYVYLKNEKKEYELARQILKSGTSIGANVEEAVGGFSRKRFFGKTWNCVQRSERNKLLAKVIT